MQTGILEVSNCSGNIKLRTLFFTLMYFQEVLVGGHLMLV